MNRPQLMNRSQPMSRCDRFEREGLLQLERGETLDAHFASCEDCRAARRAYEALEQQIASVGFTHEPPNHWQAGVWGKIEGRRAERRKFAWLRWSGPVGLAAAMILIVWMGLPAGTPSTVSLAVYSEVGENNRRRGEDYHLGDTLKLQATVDDAAHVEVRIYREERQLLMRCSEEPPCHRQWDRLEAQLKIETMGAYQVILLLAETPLPNASGNFDADLSAAIDGGARYELQEVQVR